MDDTKLSADAPVILLHGKSQGPDGPLLSRIAGAFDEDTTLVCPELPYLKDGEALERDVQAAVDVFQQHPEPVVIGKSYGAYVGAHAAAQEPVTGLVYLGYPVHAPEDPDTVFPQNHLDSITAPQFFISGENDAMSTESVFQDVIGTQRRIVPAADHSFRRDSDAGTRDAYRTVITHLASILNRLP